jgi:hypothetical protein
MAGRILARTPSCPEPDYAIMRRCWEADPPMRPSFAELCKALAAVLGDTPDDTGFRTRTTSAASAASEGRGGRRDSYVSVAASPPPYEPAPAGAAPSPFAYDENSYTRPPG